MRDATLRIGRGRDGRHVRPERLRQIHLSHRHGAHQSTDIRPASPSVANRSWMGRGRWWTSRLPPADTSGLSFKSQSHPVSHRAGKRPDRAGNERHSAEARPQAGHGAARLPRVSARAPTISPTPSPAANSSASPSPAPSPTTPASSSPMNPPPRSTARSAARSWSSSPRSPTNAKPVSSSSRTITARSMSSTEFSMSRTA